MKRVLFVATIDKHIERFHIPYLKWFKDYGFEVHVAANGDSVIPYCDVKFNIPIIRSPFSFKNLIAHHLLKQLIDRNNYALIHSHTPMGGVLARTASINSRKKETKVLYTAHGFHFFKGGPWKNWLFFYPVEKFLSKYTDGIITINSEDYDLMIRKKFKAEKLFMIHGIGVNNTRFKKISCIEKQEFRLKNGYQPDDFILIYPAEFIHRKNHQFIIDSIAALSLEIPQLKVIFAGRGVLLEQMKKYASELKVESYVDFLGFRADINELIALSDVGISSSKQEGLGLNLAEEMFCGLPVVATIDRGHKELVQNGFNGYLFEQNNHHQFEEFIIRLSKDKPLRDQIGENAYQSVQKFSLENSVKSMEVIYKQFLNIE